MLSKTSLMISAVIGALILGPVSVTFYQALASLPHGIRLLSTGVVISIFMLAFILIRQPFQRIGTIKYWLLGATLVLGVCLYTSSQIEVQSADTALAHYSDGKQTDDEKPASLSAWGRTVGGYYMHPAYGTAVVLNTLEAKFHTHPGKVRLLFAKPTHALFQPDGTPTDSDGISVELNAFDAKGNLGYSKNFLISQESFLKNKWIEKVVSMDGGVASVKVTLGWGPPGSTPNFDSTIVGFQVWNWHTFADQIGKLMLVCIGFFVVGLFLVLNLEFSAKGSTTFPRILWPRNALYCSLIFAGLMLIAYWSESRTSYVFFWDFRNYWEKTETLYELFKAASWTQAISAFSSSYATDYSMLPSILPSLLSLITGYPTRLNYSLTITLLYAVPAYLMVAYLAKRLIDGPSLTAANPVRNGWILASLPIFFGLPIYFETTLYLMPDIGGVILFVGSLLSASTLLDAIRSKEDETQPWEISKALLRASVSLGVLFSVMFVFRRWYVFAAAGIACSLFILVMIEILRAKQSRVQVVIRAINAAVLMAASALPLLCWVIFVWSRDFGQHDYSTLYASYKHSLAEDIHSFGVLFGVVAPFLCIIGGVLLLRLGKERRLLFLLTVSTFVACALFLHVQSPGRHHFFLLMPLLGAYLAGLTILTARRFGFFPAASLTMLLIMGGAVTTITMSNKTDANAFGNYDGWKPQYQPYAEGFSKLSHWLAKPENVEKKFCLIASSAAINQGIFSELWQIEPSIAKHGYDKRLIQLGQVDSVNGPPAPTIRQCEIFVVGAPFQTHMTAGQQSTLEIVQKDMITGTGIGAAVNPTPEIFPMGDGIEMRAYQTVRDITDEEYADLVKRFLDGKGSGYINPAANL
ncbi:hypothetical protein [Pseudomonas sp. dw_612]|uniref:hypothetical protein n=1 Tax=Pseudomonas sp. dw_612 TaxID=2720080 RepID=UPI001BD3AEF4|nr:hypothetical protein [Pseudomonas sp. dw_612]